MSTASETVRASDIEYLFDALNHAVNPITINVATLAASKNAVVKSTAGRVKLIAKRYGLNITTTAKGDSISNAATAAAAATPVKEPKKRQGKPQITPASIDKKAPKTPKRKIKTEEREADDVEVEVEVSDDGVGGDDEPDSDGDDDEMPSAKRQKTSALDGESDVASCDDEDVA